MEGERKWGEQGNGSENGGGTGVRGEGWGTGVGRGVRGEGKRECEKE